MFDRLFNFKPLNLANSIILVVLVLIIVGAVSMVACSSNIASPRPEIVSSRQAASSARLSPKGQRKPVSSHTPAPQKRLRDLLPLTASPLPTPYAGDTSDLCPPTAANCSTFSNPYGIGWSYPGVPAYCGPVSYTVTGLPSSAHAVLTPQTATSPPFSTALVINLDNNLLLIGSTVNYTIQGTEEGSGQGCGGLGAGGDSFVVLCSLQSPWNNCPTLDVTDEDVHTVVSGSPPPQTDWVVGLRKTLQVGVHPGSGSGSYSANATSWNTPANAVGSYDFGANTTNAPTSLTALSSPQVQFYWQKGNNTSANKFKVEQELVRSDMLETAVPSSRSSLYGSHRNRDFIGCLLFADTSWQVQQRRRCRRQFWDRVKSADVGRHQHGLQSHSPRCNLRIWWRRLLRRITSYSVVNARDPTNAACR